MEVERVVEARPPYELSRLQGPATNSPGSTPKCGGNPHDVLQRRVDRPPLDVADVTTVQPGGVGKSFLRRPGLRLFTDLTDSSPELLSLLDAVPGPLHRLSSEANGTRRIDSIRLAFGGGGAADTGRGRTWNTGAG